MCISLSLSLSLSLSIYIYIYVYIHIEPKACASKCAHNRYRYSARALSCVGIPRPSAWARWIEANSNGRCLHTIDHIS